MEPPHRYRVVVDRQPANTEGQLEGQLELTGADGDDGIRRIAHVPGRSGVFFEFNV
jgi:hypothetical protein